jgi:hypothetical protein
LPGAIAFKYAGEWRLADDACEAAAFGDPTARAKTRHLLLFPETAKPAEVLLWCAQYATRDFVLGPASDKEYAQPPLPDPERDALADEVGGEAPDDAAPARQALAPDVVRVVPMVRDGKEWRTTVTALDQSAKARDAQVYVWTVNPNDWPPTDADVVVSRGLTVDDKKRSLPGPEIDYRFLGRAGQAAAAAAAPGGTPGPDDDFAVKQKLTPGAPFAVSGPLKRWHEIRAAIAERLARDPRARVSSVSLIEDPRCKLATAGADAGKMRLTIQRSAQAVPDVWLYAL